MNKGFFSKEELTITRNDKRIKNHVKKAPIFSCTKCGLGNDPYKIKGFGKKGILIIGESFNDYNEIRKLITDDLNNDIKNDFWFIGALSCEPKDKITSYQISACRKNVLKAIKELRPKVIIPFGKNAMDSLVQHKMTGRLSGLSMLDWNNCVIPDQEYECFICPTWGISDIHKKRHNKDGEEFDNTDIVILKQCRKQIINAIEQSEVPFYKASYTSECFILTELDKVLDILHDALHWKTLSFDYETTGLKPFRKGHKIYSASISNGLFAYSFPFFNNKEFLALWKELLTSTNIKIAHNKKFERIWTRVILGFWPKIQKDIMLTARVIHNGKKVNLKFLTYCNFGITGYDNEIDIFLEADKEEKELYGANAFNRIEQAPLNKLLLYNAMDSLFTYKIYELQKNKLDEHTIKGNDFFISASDELSKVEFSGIHFNTITAEKEFNKITNTMDELEHKVLHSKEMKLWNKDKVFKLSAPQDLAYILFDKMNIKSKSKTATGKNSADVDSLEKYKKYPIVNDTLQWRKLKKIRDTYLKGFTKETTNGIIHTTLNLHIADTYRSSSDSPNLQNVPAHEEFAMNTIRKNIVPSKNHKLIEYDYKAMEAVVIGCVNKDPNWIKYMTNPKSDMHRDMAAKLYIREKDEVQKIERYKAKNGFVFPTIYLSYWKNTAANLWDCPDEVKQHLKDEGFNSLDDYREHVKKIEYWFWHDQFSIAKEWSDKTVKGYEKKGYVDLVTGFRCYGPMSKNEIVNKQVQGPASHCKLWTLEQVSKQIYKRKMTSRIVLEIHDSIIVDTDPAEEDYIDHLIWLYGTQKIMEHWDWLIIPLQIEKKTTEINGSWAESKEIGLLKE
jgi:DNA polymerase I-like protein with 3'-5' exonuclease and polymerase domains